MPIEFDSQRVDTSRVDDRRGARGSSMALTGGAGVVGLVVVLVVQLLGGPDLSRLLGAGSGTGSQVASGTGVDLATVCAEPGAIDDRTDCRMVKVFTVADTEWRAEFDRRHQAYRSPRLAFFSGSTTTGCGAADASVGPFYCPADEEIYLDLDFLTELQQRFGAQGDFAQAYILAHEFGHHVQNLLGVEERVRAEQERSPADANRLSVRMELQADCLAGVWGHLADADRAEGVVVREKDVAEAVRAAQAVGDDRIQEAVQGRVDPETFTHGSAAQRRQWFLTGYRAGQVSGCDTFA